MIYIYIFHIKVYIFLRKAKNTIIYIILKSKATSFFVNHKEKKMAHCSKIDKTREMKI